MREMIRNMDDETAVRVLSTITRARTRGESEEPPSPSAARQLARELPRGEHRPAPSATEADLARATLDWLAEDETMLREIRALATRPTPRSFQPELTLGTVVAVLLLLKLKGCIGRDADGRWHFQVELAELQSPLKTVIELLSGLGK